LYALFHSPGPAWTEGVGFREQPGVEQHHAFMKSLHDRELLVVGGPFLDAVSPGRAVGVAVIRAPSAEEAEAIAHEDPSIDAGLLRVEVRPWYVPLPIQP
jgi:uncharacterized protein YciI